MIYLSSEALHQKRRIRPSIDASPLQIPIIQWPQSVCLLDYVFPFFSLLTSAAKLMIDGAFAGACTICPFGDASQLRPLDGLSPPLLPRHGDGDRPGSLGDIGLSENDLLLDDGSGSPGSGSRRRQLLVF